MQCPRCGADNQDSRVACWKCFAQLHRPAAGGPQRVEPKEPDSPSAVGVETEVPPDIEPAPEPVEEKPEVEPKAEPFVLDLDQPAPEPVEETLEVEPEAEPFVLDLDQPAPAIYGPIPGLAEPEKEPPADQPPKEITQP